MSSDPSAPLCRYFSSGHCTSGTACHFRHAYYTDRDDDRYPRSPLPYRSSPRRYNKARRSLTPVQETSGVPFCHQYAKSGYCNAQYCTYPHLTEAEVLQRRRNAEVCLHFERNGWCKFGDLCHYYHPSLAKRYSYSPSPVRTLSASTSRTPKKGKGEDTGNYTSRKESRSRTSAMSTEYVYRDKEQEHSKSSKGRGAFFTRSARKSHAASSSRDYKKPRLEEEEEEEEGRREGASSRGIKDKKRKQVAPSTRNENHLTLLSDNKKNNNKDNNENNNNNNKKKKKSEKDDKNKTAVCESAGMGTPSDIVVDQYLESIVQLHQADSSQLDTEEYPITVGARSSTLPTEGNQALELQRLQFEAEKKRWEEEKKREWEQKQRMEQKMRIDRAIELIWGLIQGQERLIQQNQMLASLLMQRTSTQPSVALPSAVGHAVPSGMNNPFTMSQMLPFAPIQMTSPFVPMQGQVTNPATGAVSTSNLMPTPATMSSATPPASAATELLKRENSVSPTTLAQSPIVPSVPAANVQVKQKKEDNGEGPGGASMS